jgi:hypothetical protein
MALTTALIVGPNNAAIAGPNGAVLAGPNYAAPFTDYTQGLGMVVGNVGKADWTAAEAAWIKANASNVTFTRTVKNGERSYFTNTAAIPRATLYCNFTTALESELIQWENTYGVAAVDAMKMKAPDGSTYTGINGNETLMDFTNTTWLDLRLSSIPEYNSTNKLGNLANIDALSMDLCPLYPVKNLTPVHGNPFATEALWRTNMLACIAYVRDRVDNDIHLFVNGLRQFYHEISDFRNNPASYETYDGTDAIEPGNYGSASGIEVGLKYDLGDRWKMLYSLRALYRASAAGLCVAPAMKVNTGSQFVSEDENQRRINNLAVYALIHEADYTRFTQRGNTFSQYPGRVLPEMDIVLGTPDTAVASRFTSYDEPVAQLFTRSFGSGTYTVLYNWDNKTVAIPTTYQSAYQQIRPTLDTGLLANGTTDSAIEFAPVGTTLGPWQGMIVTQQGSTLTVTTASLAQLTGEVQLFFGVGETGMMLDTGEFIAGQDRVEARAILDIQDGDDWELSVQGKDQPGIRDDRQAAAFVPMASGAQNSGTGGQGRWVRVIIRALAPLLHRLGATEIEVKDE